MTVMFVALSEQTLTGSHPARGSPPSDCATETQLEGSMTPVTTTLMASPVIVMVVLTSENVTLGVTSVTSDVQLKLHTTSSPAFTAVPPHVTGPHVPAPLVTATAAFETVPLDDASTRIVPVTALTTAGAESANGVVVRVRLPSAPAALADVDVLQRGAGRGGASWGKL